MRTSRMITLLAVALAGAILAAPLAGCQGSTKRGSVYNIKPDRRIEAYMPGALERVHKTALEVVRDDFAYSIRREAVDAREGVIEARTARDESVRVDTYIAGGSVTRIEVKVGMLGDVQAARDILSAIEARLKQ
ncbi:MAG: DUF3568 family protein [Phycisphaerales bacterium]|nr:MAG: DUF3568 family protein [Phycisphaerales bacterium]